ncbi:MAG: tRNA dihydrouridine(20/20a) synthase DusA [Gammaproteobacteria bacterium]
MTEVDHTLCIAPMMTHTDRHFRYFLRLISRRVMLYTEMLTSAALIYGDTEKFLKYNPEELPLAIQIGGSNPGELARCAKMAEDAGYNEVNLNIGCPSARVQSGRIGACLMAEPRLVAECIAAMNSAAHIPVTVKTRIGIDNHDHYDDLREFIRLVSASGCKTFIIHARKAWLEGLSPRQNREVPPLRYEVVYRIKRDFPALEIVINGGFTSVEQIRKQYSFVDGVMIGRVVSNNPYMLAGVDEELFGTPTAVVSRRETLRRYMDYIEAELAQGSPLSHMTRHLFGLFQGKAGARAYRRYLGEAIYKPHAGIEVLEKAMQLGNSKKYGSSAESVG